MDIDPKTLRWLKNLDNERRLDYARRLAQDIKAKQARHERLVADLEHQKKILRHVAGLIEGTSPTASRQPPRK